MLSPPCCAFSTLMRVYNFPKMSPERKFRKMSEGMCLLAHAIKCCWVQISHNRFFALEHPAGASSWQVKAMRELQSQPQVQSIVFDQCQFGLTSPLGSPLRKRTRIITNSSALIGLLSNKLCKGGHVHGIIQGQELGIIVSKHCQHYPASLCSAIAAAVVAESRNLLG